MKQCACHYCKQMTGKCSYGSVSHNHVLISGVATQEIKCSRTNPAKRVHANSIAVKEHNLCVDSKNRDNSAYLVGIAINFISPGLVAPIELNKTLELTWTFEPGTKTCICDMLILNYVCCHYKTDISSTWAGVTYRRRQSASVEHLSGREHGLGHLVQTQAQYSIHNVSHHITICALRKNDAWCICINILRTVLLRKHSIIDGTSKHKRPTNRVRMTTKYDTWYEIECGIQSVFVT